MVFLALVRLVLTTAAPWPLLIVHRLLTRGQIRGQPGKVNTLILLVKDDLTYANSAT